MSKQRKGRHAELLRQILSTSALSDCPEEVRDAATEAIAEIGGCVFCGRAASRLCDFVLGHEIDETHKKWPVCKSDGEMFTCDAPLCEQCRKVVGMTTITGVPTAIDYCPHHSANHFKEYCGRPMTLHEAERLRIAVWKRSLFTSARPTIEYKEPSQ